MLGDKEAVANIAVKNLETAKKFYEETLGLTQIDAEGQEVIVFREWKFQDLRLQVAIRRNQSSHSRDMGGRQRYRECRARTEDQGRRFRTLRYA